MRVLNTQPRTLTKAKRERGGRDVASDITLPSYFGLQRLVSCCCVQRLYRNFTVATCMTHVGTADLHTDLQHAQSQIEAA